MLNELFAVSEQTLQGFITFCVQIGALLPVGLIMLVLAYKTYSKDQLYLANIFLAVSFALIAFMMLLNIFIVYALNRDALFLSIFQFLYVLTTLSLVFITATLIVIYKGPQVFSSIQGIGTLLVFAITSFCILFGGLKEFDAEYQLIPKWTPLFFALVVGFALFYSVITIFISLKIRNHLDPIIKRKFNRFLTGTVLLLCGYWNIILFMIRVIPFSFRIFAVPFMVAGGILMYQGIIRKPKNGALD
jgi:hypothetical protein